MTGAPPPGRPPFAGLALTLLAWAAGGDAGRAMAADLAEEYGRFIRPRRGRGRAAAWYWWQVVRSAGAQGGVRLGAALSRGRMTMTGSLGQDVRYALRGLVRRPVFTLTAVLTLALGVGGTAAIHAVLRGTILRPLPFPEADRLQLFWQPYAWQPRELALLRGTWDAFASVGAFWPEQVVVQAGEGPASAEGAVLATHELFEVLGREPVIGRTLSAEDEEAALAGTDAPPVAVITHGLWQELGGGSDVLERTIRVNGRDTRIVGVMPADFAFPGPDVRIWRPLAIDPEGRSGFLALLGRLRPEAGSARVAAELERVTTMLGATWEYPAEYDRTRGAALTPLETWLHGDTRTPLLLVAGALVLTLLIACANVAALLLARTDARRGELAVRRALGAGRARLARQLWTETLVLGAVSGLAAAGVGALAFRVLRGALPVPDAVAATLSLDPGFLFGAVAIGVLTGAVVGTGPALALAGGKAVSGSRGVSAARGAGSGRLESALVVAEVALALVLVAGAGILVRSVDALSRVDAGIRPEGVVVADLVAGAGDFPAVERPELYRRVLERVQALPGVAAAGFTQKLPLRGSGWITGLEGPDGEVFAAARFVSPGYLDALGVPLLSGRMLDPVLDGAQGSPNALVNETLARRLWGEQEPLGRELPDAMGRVVTVVGIVGDVKEGELTDPPGAAMYTPLAQSPFLSVALVVRGRPEAEEALAATLRAAVRDTEPRIAVQAITTLSEVLDRAQGEVREVMRLLGLLAALALVLGAVGVYGVLSHWVARRRHAWALSLALGATPGRVVRSVFRRGATLVVSGILLGLAGFLVSARAAAALLYGVGPADPASLALGMVALLAAGALAAGAPALRAGRVDPMVSLKGD